MATRLTTALRDVLDELEQPWDGISIDNTLVTFDGEHGVVHMWAIERVDGMFDIVTMTEGVELDETVNAMYERML